MEKRPLLIEIGTEELPASFVARALEALPGIASTLLDEARLTSGAMRALGTPRRLALRVDDVPVEQPDVLEEVVGPPASVALDARRQAHESRRRLREETGSLARRASRGAHGQGRVRRRDARREGPSGARGAGFARSDARRAHPLPEVDALGGGRRVVRTAGALAGRLARRRESSMRRSPAFAPDARRAGTGFSLRRRSSSARRPSTSMRSASPTCTSTSKSERNECSARSRPQRTRSAAGCDPTRSSRTSARRSSKSRSILPGRFDKSFLDLPGSLVVSVMRDHQRYFALGTGPGATTLLPCYLNVANTANNPEVIARGNDRVLEARLRDARFFIDEDQKRPLGDRVPQLDRVVFQTKLGSIGDKVRRIEALAASLVEGDDARLARQAARLCKAESRHPHRRRVSGAPGRNGHVLRERRGRSVARRRRDSRPLPASRRE